MIKENFSQLEKRIKEACFRVGRDPSEVSLLPISKTKPSEMIREAASLGYKKFGENKILEAEQKSIELKNLDLRWSIVGHVQTNKVKNLVRFASEVQSLDSLRLAEELDKRLLKLGRSIDVLIQVNTSHEEQKSGLLPEEVLTFSNQLKNFSTLNVKGLMTLALFTSEESLVRPCFQNLKNLQEKLRQESVLNTDWSALSMGMSGDFEMAIEEGATEVRVGQSLFGLRD